MTTINDVRIVSTNWIPIYQDSGYDAVIESLAPQGLVVLPFLDAVNAAGSQPDMTLDMLLEYISSRKQPPVSLNVEAPPIQGALQSIQVLGAQLPATPARAEAPSGLGQSADGIWFDLPDENGGGGTTTLHWYLNGEFMVEQEGIDLTVSRSVTKAELGCQAGDTVQIAIVISDTVGWFGRIEIT